jgi:hypothetical protein
MSFLDSVLGVVAPIAGGALGSEIGGLAGDFLGGAADVGLGATLGGALGGGLGGYLANQNSPTAGVRGALNGAATGPSIDNWIASQFGGNNFGMGSLGGGLFNRFGSSSAGTPLDGSGGGASGGWSGGAANGGLGGGATATSIAPLASASPVSPALGATSAAGGGGIMDMLQKNPQMLLAAAGLGASALMGNQPVAAQDSLNTAASNLNGTAGLVNSLSTGQLPPGAAQQVSQFLNDKIAGIQSKYAGMGLSGSTMEQQDIASAQAQAAAMTFSLAQQATQTGLQAAGLQDQIYSQLANIQLSQDQSLQNALASFASAAGGGGAGGTGSYKLVAG